MFEPLSFPAATPESAGIPSPAIKAFLDRLTAHCVNLHSVLLIRNGKLVVEGYWMPYHRERKHRLYSASKTFTALAIGKMVTEGRLRLDDRVVTYFPDITQDGLHSWQAATTVRDLLTMRGCHRWPPYGIHDKIWIPRWFQKEPDHKPGTIHTYDTMCTNVLCALVERETGQNLVSYLRPVFDELGVSKDIWCIEMPDGYSWGGAGIMATPLDLAKVAYLFMKEGYVNGRQLIDADFMREATSRIADNFATNGDPELQWGYGYQIWRTRHNSFSLLGLGSQIATGIPDKDMMLVTTAYTHGSTPELVEILSAFWQTVYPVLADAPLPENPAGVRAVAEVFRDAKIPAVTGAADSDTARRVHGKTYHTVFNPTGIKEARFEFSDMGGQFHYVNATGEHCIAFGWQENLRGVFPETYYPGTRFGTPKNAGYEMHASGAWSDDRTLLIYVHITDDHHGYVRINATFTDDDLTMLLVGSGEGILGEYNGYVAGTLAD